MTALVWFRSDLRTDDNTALYNALTRHQDVQACFLVCEQRWQQHDWGARRQHWVWQHALSLRDMLAKNGVPLHILHAGDFDQAAEQLAKLSQSLDATAVYANAEYPVDERLRDERVARVLQERGIQWHLFHDYTLLPPGSVRTKNDEPFKVFSPFRRAWLRAVGSDTVPCLTADFGSRKSITPPNLPAWRPPAASVDAQWWSVGEHAAHERLQRFVTDGLFRYKEQRDFPALDGTSRLSPYLNIGVISVRRCFEAGLAANHGEWDSGNQGAVSWLSELIWREFYQHVMVAFPRVSRARAFRPETDALIWRGTGEEFDRWRQGSTGFPLVDAAMRQLAQTGWMHNRLRMVTAMFLSKYLLIDWRHGERWFNDQLLDSELGANNGGWQWSASSGTDAAPYFRVLSPVRQAERFDADGAFTRRFVPELRDVSAKALLTPGCPELLATGYPTPMVDLKVGRERALAAFRALSKELAC